MCTVKTEEGDKESQTGHLERNALEMTWTEKGKITQRSYLVQDLPLRSLMYRFIQVAPLHISPEVQVKRGTKESPSLLSL